MKDVLKWLMGQAASVPAWIVVYASLGVVLVAGLIMAIFHAKRFYVPFAVAVGGIGLFLLASVSQLGYLLGWAGVYLVWCVLVWLLFLIPFGGGSKADRSEELYEKFRLDLEVPPEQEEDAFPKVYGEEESELQLSHVLSFLAKLNECDLSAGDRLELDAISRALDAYRGRALSVDEMSVVNDCLSTTLKLTAKYKL